VNGHPSLLPRYRGPSPVSWAIRNGETELGFTFHRMDPELDTGAILAQAPFPLGDEHSWEELEPKLVEVVTELLPRALARVEQGDPGDPQPAGVGEYLSTFEPGYAWIDGSRSVAETYRQVQAWRFHGFTPGPRGALTELDGETVRVLRTTIDAGHGRTVECADGTLRIVEWEPA
jgi:methionyl-tRNA formyltransferase